MKNHKMLTEADIDYLEQRLEEKFLTKDDFIKFKDDIFTKLDRILKEIVTSREEQTVIAHRVSNHEDKIEALEEIHPLGKHSS